MTVPQFGHAAALALSIQDLGNCLQDRSPVGADQRVGSLLDGDRAFGVGAQRQARHTERGGFLLQATGVGQDEAGACHQTEHFQVALRRKRHQAPGVDQIAELKLVDVTAGAGMHREHQRQFTRHLAQDAEQRTQHVGIVDIRGPVQRHDTVAFGVIQHRRIDVMRAQGVGGAARVLAIRQQRIDHHVAAKNHALRRDAFQLQIVLRRCARWCRGDQRSGR